MANFVDYLLRPTHVLMMLATWALITIFQRFVPAVVEHPVWARVLPLAPILFCSGIVWLPGLTDGGPSEKVLLGIVLGVMCGQAHKILSQTVFGRDDRISGFLGRV